MKHYFMKMKLSYRLFLIIIFCFLFPCTLLFFSTYQRAENMIKEKTRETEGEHIRQAGSFIENICLNIINTSNCLASFNIYEKLLYEEHSSNDFLTAYQNTDELIQNINHSLLNSQGEISIFSKNTLLYSTEPFQNVEYQDFYKSYIEENDTLSDYSPYFSGVHFSYIKHKTINYISCIRKIYSFHGENYYLVISIPVSTFEDRPDSATGTLFLLDSVGNTICLTLILITICLSVTFYCIYYQLKPLLLLKENTDSVSTESLKAEIAAANSQDEIGILTRTFHDMLKQINTLIDDVKKKEQEKNELKFEILLTQINSHFLFNTLNSIKWMSIVAHTDNITAAITSLGRLLEISMNKANDILPVREELTNLKSYIQIQQIRYPGRFEIQYDIDDDILSCSTPKLVLQPLAENSILHNIERKEFLTIRISGQKKGNLLVFTVWDSGCGIPPEKLKSILRTEHGSKTGQVFKGIGVYNVHERIQLIYGNRYGLQYESDGISYTKAILSFPEKAEQNVKGEDKKDDKGTDSR